MEQIRQDGYSLIPNFGFNSTCSAGGTTTTLIDAAMLLSTLDTTTDYAGAYVFRPDAALAADRIRVIASVTLATGTITIADEVWTNAPANGEQYEVMGPMDPNEFFNLLVRVTRRIRMLATLPVTRFTGYETIGNWTANGQTIGFDTTAANVPDGADKSLKVTSAGSNGGCLGPTIYVQRSRQIYASVIARASAAGYTARAIFYDVTNSAEFGTAVTSTYDRFMRLRLVATVPATCDLATLKLGGTALNEIAYFDPAVNGPWQGEDQFIYLPSYVTERNQVKRLRQATYLASSDTADVFDGFARKFTDWRTPTEAETGDWDVEVFPQAANPARLVLNRVVPMEDLYLEVERYASEFTAWANTAAGETSPSTTLKRDFISAVVADEIFAMYVPTGDARTERARARVAALARDESHLRPGKSAPQPATPIYSWTGHR
jgi:hypothetical protein